MRCPIVLTVGIIAVGSFAFSIFLMSQELHRVQRSSESMSAVAATSSRRASTPLVPASPPPQSIDASTTAAALRRSCDPWPGCALPPRPPRYWTLCELLKRWRPEDPSPAGQRGSPAVGESAESDPLPVFDWAAPAELDAARQYREAELPFVLTGVPEVTATVQRWDDAFLRRGFQKMRRGSYKVEKSSGRNGHFLYYSKSKGQQAKQGLRGGWKAPERDAKLQYIDFEAAAAAADRDGGADETRKILYLTISSGAGAATDWIVDGLSMFRDSPFFRPAGLDSSFHGINCRLGMRGAIQAAHYDHGRNFIAILKGAKRYLIQPPSACRDLLLLGRDHPSARHSSFDWAAAEETFDFESKEREKFCASEATELVLRAGQVLYLPSYWFHYIVSLNRNVQCNSRSGSGEAPAREINRCMQTSTLEEPTGAW